MIGQQLAYIRVSTFDQNPDRQLDAVAVDRVFVYKALGKDVGRPQLEALLAFARDGDPVVVHSMDRLARNLDDLRRLVRALSGRGGTAGIRQRGPDLHRRGFAHAARKVQELALVVGENICRRRKAMGLTQAQLAERLGMGPDSLSRIEKGVVAPRFERLAKMAGELDCAAADLFRVEDEPLSVKLDTLVDMLRPLLPDDGCGQDEKRL